jgi:hypothetical protein
LARLGLSDEPSKAAPYLRAILTFIREAGEEQIKQIPVVGPLLAGASAALIELSAEEDGRQLEQRIESLLSVGTQTQEDIKLLTGLAGLIFLQQSELVRQLQGVGLQATTRQLSEFATGAALIAYRSRVARDYQYIDNRGIEGGTRASHAASLPLDDIYILPRFDVERERENVREREKDILKRLVEDRGDITFEQRVRLEEEYAVITGERWRPGTKSQEEGIALGRVLEQARHAVIIGGPGVGKSALTRYVARVYALGTDTTQERFGLREQLTPIVLPFAAFADARTRRADLKLRTFLDERMTERGGDALRVAIAEELEGGRAFILLDGVDEVPESHARAAIVQAVDEFIADHAGNRCLVTSRPYGYVRLGGEISHFQLLNFSPTQVEEFIRRWQQAFEKRQHPDAPNLKNAEEEADVLIGEIRRSSKVTELATNPLMLVIISLIRYERARLPEERVQLYHRAVNTLMDTWNQWRSQLGKEVGGTTLPLDRLTRVWGAVAEWMRRTKPTGVIHRAELKRELIEVLKEKELDEDMPEATAESYLKAAADRAGLLEERGFDIFAFWHPTFEEFLAAVELSTPTSKAAGELLKLRGDPRWREVLLLAVGYVGVVQRDPDTATHIVEELAYRDCSPEEPIIHPYLRLAAACVADDVGVKRTLSQRIIVDLARVIRSQPYRQLTATFVQTVRALPALRARADTISALAPLAKYEEWEVRMEAARLFSNVTTDNAEARSLCEQMLEDDDPDVRCHAALGLARAGDNRLEVWRSVMMFMRPYTHVKPAVLEFMAGRAEDSVAALQSALLSEDYSERHYSFQAARLLGYQQQVRDFLLEQLSAESPGVRFAAARKLTEAYSSIDQVSETLRSLLNAGWADESGKREEAESLLSLYESDNDQPENDQPENDTEALYAQLISGSYSSVYQAMRSLQNAGEPDEKIARSLTTQLGDDDPSVRYTVAANLIRLGSIDEPVVTALTSCLTAEDAPLRVKAAQMLFRIGRAGQDVVDSLRPLLDSTDVSVQVPAAFLLGRLSSVSEEVINALLTILIEDKAGERIVALSILKANDLTRDAVIKRLLSRLNADDLEDRVKTAALLTQLGSGDAALETVAKMASPQPWAALGAFDKILKCQPLAHDDGEALAALTTIQDDDSPAQRKARELIFSWLWQKLEPQNKEAAAA